MEVTHAATFRSKRRDEHCSSGIRNECNLPQANPTYRIAETQGDRPAGRLFASQTRTSDARPYTSVPPRASFCLTLSKTEGAAKNPFPSVVVGCGVGDAPRERNDPFHRAVEDAGPYGTWASWRTLCTATTAWVRVGGSAFLAFHSCNPMENMI